MLRSVHRANEGRNWRPKQKQTSRCSPVAYSRAQAQLPFFFYCIIFLSLNFSSFDHIISLPLSLPRYKGWNVFNWLFIYWGRISLCSHDWIRTCYVDQVGLQLTKICLPLGLKACATNKRWATFSFFFATVYYFKYVFNFLCALSTYMSVFMCQTIGGQIPWNWCYRHL